MAQNIIFRVVADTQPAVDGMNKLGNATDKTKKDVSQLDDALGKIGGMLAGAFAVDKLIAFGKEVMNVTKQFEGIQIRLNSIAGGAIEGQKAMDDLRLLANKLGMEFKSLASEYTNFVGAAKASGMEVAKADKIFKSMSIAIAGSGANAEVAGRAMTALTQMIGKGKISAEELRSQLGEALPQSFGIMAKSLGVTTQELDKMMASGQLMADEVLPKFAKEMEKAFGGDAEKLAEGLQGSLNRLSNAWDNFMLNLGESAPIGGAVNALTGLINAVDRGVQVLKNGTTETYLAGKKTEQTLQAQAVIKDINQKLDEKQLTTDQKKEALNKMLEASQKAENKLLVERYNLRKEIDKGGGDLYSNKRRMFDLFELTQKQQVYTDAIKSELQALETEGEAKKKATKLTDAQIKAIERERLERIKLKREMDKALKDIFNVDFTEPVQDPNFVGPPTMGNETYFQRKTRQRQQEEKDKQKDLEQMRKWQGIFETEQGKAFQSELSELDQQYQAKLIKDEEYLVALSALRKKYGIEDKKNINNFESDILTTKAKKEQLKRDIIIETARGTVDTIMAYKQKELDGEADMVAKQREQGLISQEQYDQQLRAIKRKQAIADRINAIANIAIGTAVQVATNPPPLAPFLIAMGAIQTGIVMAQPMPYNKGTKRVPMMRGAVRGRDSVHAILTPDERVVPADINMQPGYSALLDLAQDKKISDKEAGFLAELATSGMRRTGTQQSIDPDIIGKAIAKHIPHTNVAINDRGIAVITERSQTEIRRLRRRIG